MPKFKCLKPCKIDKQWTSVGQIIELSKKEDIAHLKNHNAIEETTQTRELTPSEELQRVNGVNAKIADILVSAGITDVDKLSAYTVPQLVEINGIGQKTAQTIYNAFT